MWLLFIKRNLKIFLQFRHAHTHATAWRRGEKASQMFSLRTFTTVAFVLFRKQALTASIPQDLDYFKNLHLLAIHLLKQCLQHYCSLLLKEKTLQKGKGNRTEPGADSEREALLQPQVGFWDSRAINWQFCWRKERATIIKYLNTPN